jgi:hypothetical protein
MEVSLFELIVTINLLVSLFLSYTIGKIKGDIETLYEGLAMTMKSCGLAED